MNRPAVALSMQAGSMRVSTVPEKGYKTYFPLKASICNKMTLKPSRSYPNFLNQNEGNKLSMTHTVMCPHSSSFEAADRSTEKPGKIMPCEKYLSQQKNVTEVRKFNTGGATYLTF
jgi:hypothetical protein